MLLAVGLVAAAPAGNAAPTNKTFTGSLSVAGGASLGDPGNKLVTVTLTNTTKQPQAFASANVNVPSGLTFCTGCPAAPGPDVAGFVVLLDSSSTQLIVKLRSAANAGVAPGQSIHFAAWFSGSVADCGATWPVEVKQSNDFSGTGNDFAGPPALSVASLYFKTQPTDTQYQPSTDNPATTAPVVAAAGNCGDISLAGQTVSLTDSAGNLNSAGSTVIAAGATATFNALTWSSYNFTDTLTATVTGYSSVTSNSFYVYQVLKVCPPSTTPCTTAPVSDTGKSTFASVTVVNSSSGNQSVGLSVQVPTTPPSGCGEPAGVRVEATYGANVTVNVTSLAKTVTMELPKKLVNLISNNGTPFLDICLTLPSTGTPFKDKFGNMVTSGLLGDCSSFPVPCVVSRNKNAGDEYVVFKLLPGDPVTGFRA